MAQFRGTLRGTGKEVSRLGHKPRGLVANVNGWRVGVRVEARHEDGKDVLYVYRTGGSMGGGDIGAPVAVIS